MKPAFVARPEKVADPSYEPSFEHLPPDLAAGQRAMLAAVRQVEGWLLDEDMLKLYELAFLSEGPVLEIGTYHGRSAVVIGRALRDAGTDARLYSLDVDPAQLAVAAETIAEHGLTGRVVLVRASVERFLYRVRGLAPGLVFLDGDHTRSGVARDLRALRGSVPPEGVVLVHDYNDSRNADPMETDYGVVAAVERSWLASECDFGGVFGACGLFRRRSASGRRARPLPPVFDLGGQDALRWWVKSRVVTPAARRLKGLARGRTM